MVLFFTDSSTFRFFFNFCFCLPSWSKWFFTVQRPPCFNCFGCAQFASPSGWLHFGLASSRPADHPGLFLTDNKFHNDNNAEKKCEGDWTFSMTNGAEIIFEFSSFLWIFLFVFGRLSFFFFPPFRPQRLLSSETINLFRKMTIRNKRNWVTRQAQRDVCGA